MGGVSGSSEGMDRSLVIERDFNVVRYPYKKSRHNQVSKPMKDFSSFIEAASLILHLMRASFTQSNGQNLTSMSSIDRSLPTPKRKDRFPNVVQVALPNARLDRIPILLQNVGFKIRPPPFHFELMWLEVEGKSG